MFARLGLSERKSEALAAYLFILPALALLVFFVLVPMVQAFLNSFYDYNLIANQKRFVGFANYTRLFRDSSFFSSLKNSFYFGIIVIPIQTALALGLALLIKKPSRLTGFFRTAYFLPYVISMGVAASLFKMVYNTSSGLLNAILKAAGLPPVSFLSTPSIAMIGVAMMGIWKSAGFFMMIFLSGLNNIPSELYEAASLDGASSFKSFRYITLPLLKGVMSFIVVMTTMDALKIFIPIYVTMRGGGPGGATRTAAYFIYNTAFKNMDMGYASAAAIIFFLIIVVLSLIQLRLLNGKDK